MSTYRNTTSGPDVPQILIKSAFVGAVTTIVLIPTFREILAQLASIQQGSSLQSGPFSEQAATILFAGDFTLALIPIISTIGMVIFAYSRLGGLGVGLYLVLSTAASGMLAGSTTAVLTFVFGAMALTVIWAIKSRTRRNRPVPIRR